MATPTYSSAHQRLIERLNKLPGLGRRSAERIAFHLLKSPESEAAELAAAIREFRTNLKVCSACGYVSESDPCPICADPKRDQATVLVVEQPADVASLESVGQYRGVYHVLMGRLAPLDGVGAGELTTERLLARVKKGGIREVIIGTQPTLEGDGTAMWLSQALSEQGVRVTRLARGLPVGASLDVVSKAVLADAIQGRQAMG